MELPTPGEIEEGERNKKMLEEKRKMWDDTVNNSGCKKEIDELQKCSEEGDWRKCQQQMKILKECMDKSKKLKE